MIYLVYLVLFSLCATLNWQLARQLSSADHSLYHIMIAIDCWENQFKSCPKLVVSVPECNAYACVVLYILCDIPKL